MLIDWFTVAAQALNFLILVWLMKRMLYKPILLAIHDREERIASELADAAAKQAEAKEERDTFREKNEVFDGERAALLKQARDEAGDTHQRLLEEAREDARILRVKEGDALRSDAKNLTQTIAQGAQREVFAIARKALMDLAVADLEAQMADVFIRRLRALDASERAGLAEALRAASGPALVRSAFDLPEAQREAIEGALTEILSEEVHLRFEAAPELVCGIELTTQGQKVAWSIAEYLRALEQGVGELVKGGDTPKAKVEPRGAADPPSGGSADADSEPLLLAEARRP